MTSRIFPVVPFNTAGEFLLTSAINQCSSGKMFSSYGELVLHVSSQTSADRAQQLIKSALKACDEKSVECTLAYVDALLGASNSKEFWQQPLDRSVQSSGIYAMDIWKQLGLPTDPAKFQSLQKLFFGAGVINFVNVVCSDSTSRAAIERYLRKGFLGRLFG